jgi:hypothetical protein
MKKAVFCLATNDEQAQRIVDHLLSSGFSNEDISILYPDRSNRGHAHENVDYDETTPKTKNKKGTLGTEKNTKAPEGGAVGAATGGILGGSLGLLAGIGALAIPGLGPFIAAGPIMAALSGSAIGGSVGLLIGALVGAGIPEYEAKKYETGLKAGHILLSVHVDDSDEKNRAHDIMKKEGAKDISTTSEKAKR